MVQMAASSKINFYFCNVKSNKRHEVAAKKQRFLCLYIIVNSKRKEWVNGNVPEVSACLNLTAPTALSLFNVKYKQV
jgi:hypothetical protein